RAPAPRRPWRDCLPAVGHNRRSEARARLRDLRRARANLRGSHVRRSRRAEARRRLRAAGMATSRRAGRAQVTTRTRRTLIVIGILVGGVVALNLLARGIDRAVGGNEPGGVTGSSYATSGDGLAAYASLLRQFGHQLTTQRGDLTRTEDLTPDATAIVIDPNLITDDDATVLLQFVTSGGRLVIGGARPLLLRDVRRKPTAARATGTQRRRAR